VTVRPDKSVGADFWLDRPTLVTGATGLVGGWLVRGLLKRGATVVCLVRDELPVTGLGHSGDLHRVVVVRGDVCDRDVVERALGEYGIVSVFHLAAQTVVGVANRNPVSTFESNVRGTWSLLEACRRSPLVSQIVTASSDKAYGDAPPNCTEDSPLMGRHPYDVSKSCADLIAQAYAHTYGTPVAITRCGNFFGGGDLNWNRIVPSTIRSVLRDQRPVIRSDGAPIRDYLYVEDGAEAYVTLAEQLALRPSLAGEAFNFSNQQPLSVLSITRMILTAMESTLEPVILAEASNEILEQSLNAERARTTLGWRSRFNTDEGLAQTIAWYRAYFAAIVDHRAPTGPGVMTKRS